MFLPQRTSRGPPHHCSVKSSVTTKTSIMAYRAVDNTCTRQHRMHARREAANVTPQSQLIQYVGGAVGEPASSGRFYSFGVQ